MMKERFSELVHRHTRKIIEIAERIEGVRGETPRIEIDLGLEEIRRLYDLFLGRYSDAEAMYLEEVVKQEDNLMEEEAFPEKKIMAEKEQQEAEEQEQEEQEQEEQKERQRKEQEEKKERQRKEAELAALEGERVSAEEKAGEDRKRTDRQGGRGKQEKKRENEEVSTTLEEENGNEHKTILAEKYRQGETKSINDIIAARRSDVSISARLQQHPIADLRSAIGINEKFIFVYELFGGNVPQYNEAIERLNSMPEREAAISLMEEYRSEYHWDIENMAFQKLVDMVSRRYS